jgi:hypothetical protein
MKQIQSKIKISRKNYVYHLLNFIVQVIGHIYCYVDIYISYLVLAEDAIKAAINDYNSKKNKQN